MPIGDSTTLSPGATIISPTGTTAVTSATIETGTGAVTVGTGGVLSIDQSGTTATAIVLGDAVGLHRRPDRDRRRHRHGRRRRFSRAKRDCFRYGGRRRQRERHR